MKQIQQVKRFLGDVTKPRERILCEQFAFGAREALIHSLSLDKQTFFLATIQPG